MHYIGLARRCKSFTCVSHAKLGRFSRGFLMNFSGNAMSPSVRWFGLHLLANSLPAAALWNRDKRVNCFFSLLSRGCGPVFAIEIEIIPHGAATNLPEMSFLA
ncbi:hypothetical protein [Cupriavidus pinatubonensis]|uniref:hypothetical protein n=1 Tax=Cupriavidus pinatubonensis TaxID=248026 RepID=UPI001CC546F6|nr:hypothetical protein [Cupriavidus pinatubonensis]